MTMLSPHFSLAELTKSALASRMALDNSPSHAALCALQALCVNVLEPVRALARERAGKGVYVVVSSGHRSAQVNRAAGGSGTSQHQKGEAADIEVPGVSNYDLALWISESTVPYDQLILEHYVPGVPASGWVHVSHSATKNRRQVLTASRQRGSVVYTAGLGAS